MNMAQNSIILDKVNLAGIGAALHTGAVSYLSKPSSMASHHIEELAQKLSSAVRESHDFKRELKMLKQTVENQQQKIMKLINEINNKAIELDMCMNILGQLKTVSDNPNEVLKIINKYAFEEIDMALFPNIH